MPSRQLLLLLALSLFTSTSFTSSQDLDLLPQPKQVQVGSGVMALKNGLAVEFVGFKDERIARAVDRLYIRLSSKLGFVVLRNAGASQHLPTLQIESGSSGAKVPRPKEDESYDLQVTADRAVLHGSQTIGVLRGLETFYQLATQDADGYGSIPAVSIHDEPRFAWRGLLLDVTRHFLPKAKVENEIDGLAAVKMNVLHLHLSDDQAFRVESEKYPELARQAADAQFYTKSDIREIVAYAADRGVRVVPEFDVPGHTAAWLQAYPDMAVNQKNIEAPMHFGGYENTLDPTNPKLLKFLDKLFAEMAALFPDEYFHIGGDEVRYKIWDQSAEITQYRQKHNIADDRALQAHFNADLEKILRKHGKRMIGWNEILHGDLPKDTVIQSWIGVQALEEAVSRGYSVVVSLGYYLDWYMPASFHYGVDPLLPNPNTWDELIRALPPGPRRQDVEQEKARAAAFKASPDAERLVLGGEAAEWTELTAPWTIDAEIWPRLGAIGERLWSPAEVKDIPSLYRRLQPLKLELSDLGIRNLSDVYVLRTRLAGEELAALNTFAEALEPLKMYTRHAGERKAGNYIVNGRFNRLVDSLAPESAAARRFHLAVQQWSTSHSEGDLAAIKAMLQRWRDNDPAITSLVAREPRLSETQPLVDALRALADSGLDALSYLSSGRQAPSWWLQAQGPMLDASSQSAAGIQLAIVDDVRQLILAAAATRK